MIDLLKLTRKNIINLWNILGDKWVKTKNNSFTRQQVESFWFANDLLNAGRLNDLENAHRRLTQFSIYGVLDILNLTNLSNNITTNLESTYHHSYKYYYSEINNDVKYIYSPLVLTNTLLPPHYAELWFTMTITNVNIKNNWLQVLPDPRLNTGLNTFENYIFFDENKNPFIIRRVKNNVIHYEPLISKTSPITGELSLVNKFELHLDKDFICEQKNDHIIFKLKNFTYIESLYTSGKNLFESDIDLYSVNVYYLDDYNYITFGQTNNISQQNYQVLTANSKKGRDDVKLLNLWRLAQRPFNFYQGYRLGAILTEEPHATHINGYEVIYDINYQTNEYQTAILQNELNCRLLRLEDLPTELQIGYAPDKSKAYKFVELQGLYNTDNLSLYNIYLLDNQVVKLKRILGTKYLEFSEAIVPKAYIRKLKILDIRTQKSYKANDYSLNEVTDYDIIPFRKVTWGSKSFGSFNWGEIYGKKVVDKCVYKRPEIGRELLYGDALSQTLLIDYFESDVFADLIQKQLAILNKPFTQDNVDFYRQKPALLLHPFINYSVNDPRKYIEYLITEDAEFIIQDEDTNSKIIIDTKGEWIQTESIEFNTRQETSYNLEYKNIVLPNVGSKLFYMFGDVLNNKTNICFFSFFVRVNSGAIKIGVSSGVDFDTADYMKFATTTTTGNWIHKKLYFDLSQVKVNKILLQSQSEDTNIDIFGLELFQSVPTFSENLSKQSSIFTNFLQSNDYNIINLL